MQSLVLYVIPVTSILGRLGLVPMGETGTIPFSMRKESTPTFQEQPVIQRWMLVTAIDGGISTVGP